MSEPEMMGYPPNLPPPFQPPAEEPLRVPRVVQSATYVVLMVLGVLSLLSTVVFGISNLVGDVPAVGVYWMLWGGMWTAFWFAMAHLARKKPERKETP